MAAFMHRARLLQGAALLLACSGALAAGTAKRLPMGLYKIDTGASMGAPDGSYSMQGKVDGASGKTVLTNRLRGVTGPAQHSDGPPVTHCIASANMWRLPNIDNTTSHCTRQETKVVGEQVEHRAYCPSGNVKVTLRQLDQQRWEYITEVTMDGKGAAPNLMFMKPALKEAIARAKSPLEKAEAERRLAELESQQNQMVDQRGAAVAKLSDEMRRSKDPEEKETLRKTIAAMGGPMPLTSVTREIWTRIADTCAAPPP